MYRATSFAAASFMAAVVGVCALEARAAQPNPIAGAIDFHAYGAPDFFPRDLTDIEVAQLAARHGMRALVLMSHITSTADRAAITSIMVPEIEVFGGVTLNYAVGGLNPAAVEVMAAMQGGRGKVVWLPTIDADHHRKTLGMPGEGIVVARNGRVTAATEAIMELVAAQDLVLATGHVSPDEVLAVVERASQLGIHKVVVTSPMSLPGLNLEQMRRAAEMGAYLELDYVNQLMGEQAHLEWMRGWPRVAVQDMAAVVQALGAEHFILGSELGQVGNPIVPDGYMLLVEGLKKAGVTMADVDLMMKHNPARLLGLDDQPS